jgi:predicted transcriptional regulator
MTSDPDSFPPEPQTAYPSSLDTLLTLLSEYQRRRVVTELVEDSPRSVEELVDTAARGDARTLEIALVHEHLPKLQEAGFIEWETDTGTVRRGPEFDTVETVIGLIRSNQEALPIDWP